MESYLEKIKLKFLYFHSLVFLLMFVFMQILKPEKFQKIWDALLKKQFQSPEEGLIVNSLFLKMQDGRSFDIKKSNFKATNFYDPQTPTVNLVLRDSRDPIVKEIPILLLHTGIYYLSYAFWAVMISLMVIVATVIATGCFMCCSAGIPVVYMIFFHD
jgi:hypothetical protein